MNTLTVWRFARAGGRGASRSRSSSAGSSRARPASTTPRSSSWPPDRRNAVTRELGGDHAPGRLWGGFWGVLLGLIFLTPLAGPTFGAAAGAVAGTLADFGVADDFV